jgi:hypothetical protein
MAKINLALILKITAAAEQALIAFLGNDQKGIKKYLTVARDTIDSILATL